MRLKNLNTKKLFSIHLNVELILCLVLSLAMKYPTIAQYIQYPIIDSVNVLPESPLEYDAYKLIIYSKNIHANCQLDSSLTISSAGNNNLRLRLNFSTDTVDLLCLRVDTIPQIGQHVGVKNLTIFTKVYSSIDTLVDTTHFTYSVCENHMGIVRRESFLNLNIYPNPANNILNFALTDNSSFLNLEISDISGKIIKSLHYSNLKNGEFKNSINISDLKNGMYFCRFSNEKNELVKKFIKQ